MRLEDAVAGELDARRWIDALPPHLVVVLWLRAVQGWTLAEIGAAHGVSAQQASEWVKAIRQRVSRHPAVSR